MCFQNPYFLFCRCFDTIPNFKPSITLHYKFLSLPKLKIYWPCLSDIPFWFHGQLVYLSCTYLLPNFALFPSLITISLVWSQPLRNDQYHNRFLFIKQCQLYLTASSNLPEHDLSDFEWYHLTMSKYICEYYDVEILCSLL